MKLLRSIVLLLFAFAVLPAGLRAQVNAMPILNDGYPVKGIRYQPLPAIYTAPFRGTTKETSIEIINQLSEPFDITAIEEHSDRFKSTLTTIEPGKRFRLTILASGNGPAGDFREVLRLKTTSSENPVLRVPVNIRLLEKVFTFPNQIFLGKLDLAQLGPSAETSRKWAQILMVLRKGHPGFEVKLSSDVPFLKFSSELGPKGDQWENWVWIDPAAAKQGDISGNIFIETNDPDFPKLTVPVNGKLN